MTNWFQEIADVVEHLVNTHPTFNQSLSQDEALGKLAVARAAAIEHDVVHGAEHPASVVDDIVQLKADVKALADAVSQLVNPLSSAPAGASATPVSVATGGVPSE